MIVLIVSVLVVLVVSALCSLLEAALLSLPPGQVADLTRRRPSVGAIWQDFKQRIERPIAVILIVNTAAHTLGATVAGAQAEKVLPHSWLLPFSVLFTYLVLQFTEILPKALGVTYNRQLAPWIAYPLAGLIWVLSPLVFLIHLVNRLFGLKRERSQPEVTLEEITAMAGLAHLRNLIGRHQERIIRGASRLSGLRADQVMIPVEEVAFLSASQTMEEAIDATHRNPHTRFPVCAGTDRNQVLGYVNIKEMVHLDRMDPADSRLQGIIRPVHFAAPEEPVPYLLQAFVDQHEHMAIVRGADGQTLGLVTLEDVIEELVGELEDEFDRLPRRCHRLGDGTWTVGGGTPVRELASNLGLPLSDLQGTLSAWLIRRFGRVPRSGEVYHEGEAEFVVRRTRWGKIFEVAVKRKASSSAQGTQHDSQPT